MTTSWERRESARDHAESDSFGVHVTRWFSAFFASSCNVAVTHPFDTFKVLKQTNSSNFTASAGGISRYYRGFCAHGTALVPAQAIHYSTKDWLASYLTSVPVIGQSSFAVHGLSGYCAFMTSFVFTNPLFAAKAILQKEALPYGKFFSVAREKSTLADMRKNVVPSSVIAISQFMVWPLFEKLKDEFAKYNGVEKSNLGLGWISAASVISAGATSAVFYPLDTIRTNIYADRHGTSLRKIIANVAKQRAFYAGFGVQLVRLSLSRSIDMSIYEHLKRTAWSIDFESDPLPSPSKRTAPNRYSSPFPFLIPESSEMASLPMSF